MSSPFPPLPRPRNRHTEAMHKRETFWQIYTPMFMALLLAIVACGLPVLGAMGAGGFIFNRVWADVSLIFLLLQAGAFALPLLIVFGGLVYGVWFVIGKLPPYCKIAQDYVALAAARVKQALTYIEKPILQSKAAAAGAEKFGQEAQKIVRGQ